MDRFYPKPRVDLGKGSQPLRCNPIVIEQIDAQGDNGGSIGPAPAHASLFHATVHDQGHRSLNHAASDRRALVLPASIRANPRTLVLEIADCLLDGFERVGWHIAGKTAQRMPRLIDAALPERDAMPVQLKVALFLPERFGACRGQDGMTDLAPQMRPVQDAGGLRKVPLLFLLDPFGSIGNHDHRARWIGVKGPGSSFSLYVLRPSWSTCAGRSLARDPVESHLRSEAVGYHQGGQKRSGLPDALAALAFCRWR
jgi:hypothetical protein